MTLTKFLADLQTKDWQLQYVSNLLSQQQGYFSTARMRPIAQAFTWNFTPEGWLFWSRIDDQYPDTCNFTATDLISSIHSIYSKTHPELFL